MKNPTRYHVLQSQKKQVKEFLTSSHTSSGRHHHHLALPRMSFRPRSAPEVKRENDEQIKIGEVGMDLCSSSAPEANANDEFDIDSLSTTPTPRSEISPGAKGSSVSVKVRANLILFISLLVIKNGSDF